MAWDSEELIGTSADGLRELYRVTKLTPDSDRGAGGEAVILFAGRESLGGDDLPDLPEQVFQTEQDGRAWLAGGPAPGN